MSMERPSLNEIEILFDQLKQIKNKRISILLESLEEGTKANKSMCSKEYEHLNKILGSQDDKEVLKRILNEQFDVLVHSFLVMIDGGTFFEDNLDFYVDLVKNDTRQSLTENDALHEWLYDFWE